MATYGKKGQRARNSFAIFQSKGVDQPALPNCVQMKKASQKSESLPSSYADSRHERSSFRLRRPSDQDSRNNEGWRNFSMKIEERDQGHNNVRTAPVVHEQHKQSHLLPPFHFEADASHEQRLAHSARRDIELRLDRKSYSMDHASALSASVAISVRRSSISNSSAKCVHNLAKGISSAQALPSNACSDNKALVEKTKNQTMLRNERGRLTKPQASAPILLLDKDRQFALHSAGHENAYVRPPLARSVSAVGFSNITGRQGFANSPTVPNFGVTVGPNRTPEDHDSASPSLVSHIKNSTVMRKVKVVVDHAKGLGSHARSKSGSEGKLLGAAHDALDGRQTPDSHDVSLMDNNIHLIQHDPPIIEESPNSATSPKESDFQHDTPKCDIPTIVDSSPKLQQFFGTNPHASPPRTRVPLKGSNTPRDSPLRCSRDVENLDLEDDIFNDDHRVTLDSEDTIQEESATVGLGIAKTILDYGNGNLQVGEVAADAGDDGTGSESNFSGFDIFSENDGFPYNVLEAHISPLRRHPNVLEFAEQPVLNAGFNPDISPLRHLPNVLAFAERPVPISRIPKREGIVLGKSPVKRITASQHLYEPDRCKPFGVSLSTTDSLDADKYTPPKKRFSASRIPVINIKRASDISKRSSAGAKIVCELPASNKTTRIHPSASVLTTNLGRDPSDRIESELSDTLALGNSAPLMRNSAEITRALSTRRWVSTTVDNMKPGVADQTMSSTSVASSEDFELLPATMYDVPTPSYLEFDSSEDELQVGHGYRKIP